MKTIPAPKLSVESLKAFATDPQLRTLVCDLLVSRVEAERLRKEIDALIAPHFAAFAFVTEGAPIRPITREDDLYLADQTNPEVAAKIAEWDALRAALIARAGYQLTRPDECPALVAGHAVITLENALMREAAARLAPGLDGLYGVGGKDREKLLRLLVDLVTGRPTPRA